MARFFKVPIHYEDGRQIYSLENTVRTPAPQVNDNDYTTYSTSTTFIIQTHGINLQDNTIVNFIRVIGSGIGSYNAQAVTGKGTGGGVSGRIIPATVMTPERTSVDTTINGVQYDLLDLRATPVVVVDNQALTGTTATIANDLTSISTAVIVTVSLTGATLTDPMTAGTVEVVGENPSGTVVRQTLTFSHGALDDSQSTTTQFLEVTAVNLSGFSAGTISITADNGVLFATEVQITFTGANIRIYQIQLLEELLYLDPERFFLNIQSNFNRNSLEKTNFNDETFRIEGLGTRGKHNTVMSTHLRKTSPVSFNSFMAFAKEYENFTFEEQYERYPDLIYLATWSPSFDINYFNRMLRNGRVVNITIQET